MSRSEDRAKRKKRKGGSPVYIVIPRGGHDKDPMSSTLNTMAKLLEQDRIGKALRSKQVPGY